MEPPEQDVELVSELLGATPVAWRPADRGGQTAAHRWVVELADGSTAFVKIAATEGTAEWLRDEHRFYAWAAERELAFLPRMLEFRDDERPALALEDLSAADWPPPWNPDRTTAVLSSLHEVHATPAPNWLPPVGGSQFDRDGWSRVEADPHPFLSLGLCSPGWLELALPMLLEASAAAPIEGDALLHLDVRSDNLCIRMGRAVLVDWNLACVGNELFDIACWIPSLEAEGGLAPEELLDPETPGLREMAAAVAGYLCSRAGLPRIPEAPHVRPLQLSQTRTALPWAARALGLPPPA
jgi:hypothetical protein